METSSGNLAVLYGKLVEAARRNLHGNAIPMEILHWIGLPAAREAILFRGDRSPWLEDSTHQTLLGNLESDGPQKAFGDVSARL